MSVNSSFFPSETLLSNLSSSPYLNKCFFIVPSSSILSGYYITLTVILVPLSILIIYHGLQHWQQHWSPYMAADVSHSDYFTYHLTIMEMIGAGGCICICYGIYKNDSSTLITGDYLWCFSWFGETIFQLFICLEHYLAVVHPITYRNLRKGRGIKTRNNAICIAWLICVATTCSIISTVLIASFLNVIALAVVFFCNLCVIFVLIHPGSGENRWFKKKIDQGKQRAVFTIVAILIVLVLRCSMNIVWSVISVFKSNNECLLLACTMWFTLPSSLLLPLLFLHKAVKLVNRNNVK